VAAIPIRMASLGILAGIAAFAAVIFAPLLEAVMLFQTGAFFIGFGGGLFAVGMLTAAMDLASSGHERFALGAWGGVQATAAGLAIAVSGVLRDLAFRDLPNRARSAAPSQARCGLHLRLPDRNRILFATLIAIGPMVRVRQQPLRRQPSGFGLAEYPG
jgi:MFS transporter, BCD family, chlorophyll transporter